MKENNIKKIYGKYSWVMIIDVDNSISKEFVKEFVKRRMNVLIVGENVRSIRNYVRNNHPIVLCESIELNYKECYKKNFFRQIKKKVREKDISILVNYIEKNVTQKPYHNINNGYIKDVLRGNYIRSNLMKILINKLKDRDRKSLIMDIHSQINHDNYFTFDISNEISIPYRSIKTSYEAFNYYNSVGIYEEYRKLKNLDFLIIKKGSIITEKNKCVKNKIYGVNANKFVIECIKCIGNVEGIQTVDYLNGIGTLFINMFPFYKRKILNYIGEMYVREISND